MIKMYFIELIFFDFSDLQIWTGKKKKNFMMGGFTLHSIWCTR